MSKVRMAARWAKVRDEWYRLDVGLIIVTIGLVLFTMLKTAVVARNASLRSDLTYRNTIEELERTLEGLGPDSIARIVPLRISRLGLDSVWVDTIAVVGDTLAEPSLAVGGFLRDQIARFNDAAVRQALGSTERRRDQPADPGNILRSVRASGGGLRLADQANAAGLIVRSPVAEREWREVITADASAGVALVGQTGSIPLLPNSSGSRATVNGHVCEVRAGPTRALLYCGAVLGSGVERFYDLAVDKALVESSMYLDTYRGRRMWLNGRSTTARGLRVSQGALGDLRSTGPFLLSGVAGGYLAAEQWVNGRRQLVEQSQSTIGFFSRAGRSARWPDGGSALRLSLDASLSAELEQVAGGYFAERGKLLDAMAVVVVDLATGRVRAVVEPWRTAPGDPLISFEPRLVGSVVKPIVAAAILARNPTLGDLVVDYGGPVVTAVDGAPLSQPFRNDANGCGARIDFDAFLRCSSNRYAAELLMRSLRRNGYTPSRDGASVPHAVLERSDIADGLALAFDVDAYAGRTTGRTVPFWDVDSRSAGGIVSAVADPSLVPYESRPWLLSASGTATPVDWLARYAFGGWENRWTLLGVAQSYARIATDREVSLSFLQAGPPKGTPLVRDSVASAMRRVRGALAEVGARGTAAPLNSVLERVLGPQVVVLAKTGTLNEASPDDLAVKVLALAVGQPASTSRSAALKCGLAVVAYFDFNREEIRRTGAAALPGVHVEFATRYLPGVLEHHWKRLSGCSAAPAKDKQ
ncbi:hypothetical protein [Gemmatimonas sp.]|uniref:hypothetical protein n=1 Tax=Gemmatimonas sp. TaxID=1962908 RepID=UPI00286E256E|nr:hypothetical protein [Gemmatimonas sp.]